MIRRSLGARGGRARIAGPRRAGPVWLFDLDNTLHHASHAIFPHINREMTAFIERALDVDTATANRLRVVYTRRYGAALLGLVRRHGIDAHAFLREVHPSTELASMVRAERGLAHTLRQLPGRRIVLTNGPEHYAREILTILGIERLFERVIAVEQMRRGAHWHAKPDATVLRRTLRQAGVRAADAILVEDSHGHLKRYRRLGIRTVWITGHLPQRATPQARAAAAAAALAKAATDASGDSQHVAGDPVAGRDVPATADAPAISWPPRVSAGRPPYVDRRIKTIRALRRG